MLFPRQLILFIGKTASDPAFAPRMAVANAFPEAADFISRTLDRVRHETGEHVSLLLSEATD